MRYIYSHYDGPLYIIPAKTFYDPEKISPSGKGLIISFPLSEKYFAAHLPLYPLLIRLFAPLVGFLQSMLFVNIAATTGLVLFFYYMMREFKLASSPVIIAVVLLFLPRFLVVRAVGAPESLFMLLILVSIFFFEKQKYLLAGLFGALSVMTKMPGILLFGAYLLVFLEQFIKTRRIGINALGILLIPLGMLSVFILYQIQYGDFFAFFHTGGVVPLVSPFSVFNFQARWVETAWLEEVVFYFFMYVLAAIYLKDSKYRSLFYFTTVFLVAASFVQHRDIARYSLPMWPFACIAFEKFFSSKKFLIALLIILPALYFYAWNFLAYNVMPISDWAPFM